MLIGDGGSTIAPPKPPERKPMPAHAQPPQTAAPAAKPDGIDLSHIPTLKAAPPEPLSGSASTPGDQISIAMKKAGTEISDALKALFGPPNNDAQPPSQAGLPPSGSMNAIGAVKDQTQQPAGPGLFTGETSKPNQNAQEAFYQVTGDGSDPGVVSAYINGTLLKTTAAQFGGLSSAQQKAYTSMTQAQRVQTAMQAMGPVGTAVYLGRLQQGISTPDSGNNFGNNQQTLQDFSNGFESLVNDGKITNGDVKSLAAAPANIIDSGEPYGNQPSNADIVGGVAHMIGDMPANLNDSKILATQNAFVGASYDTGAALLQSKNKTDQTVGQEFYAQGTQVLSQTPFTNQSQVLYDMGASQVGNVVKNSLAGEGALASGEDTHTPLTGTAGLLNTLTANAYDDDGNRLPMDSVQQREITSAYKAAVDSISNKGNGDYQNLMASDISGSGVRQALSGLFAAGLPSILNAESVKSSGGPDPVAPGEINSAQIGKFMEFELGGHYASKEQGAQIGQNIGGALGGFYNDTAALQDGTLSLQAFKEKYGSSLFANTPNSGVSNQNASVQDALSVFGSILHGANAGFSDLDARNATNSDRWAADAGFLGGLVATAGAALTFDPETAPLGAIVSSIGAGAGASSFIPGLDNDLNPSGNLNWANSFAGQSASFTNSALYQLLGSVFNNSTFSPLDKDAFARGLGYGQ